MSKNYDSELTAFQLVEQLRKRETISRPQWELLFTLVEQENTPEKRMVYEMKRAKQAVTRTKREVTYCQNKLNEALFDYSNAKKDLKELQSKNPA